jgi:translation initiation factor IF-1
VNCIDVSRQHSGRGAAKSRVTRSMQLTFIEPKDETENQRVRVARLRETGNSHRLRAAQRDLLTAEIREFFHDHSDVSMIVWQQHVTDGIPDAGDDTVGASQCPQIDNERHAGAELRAVRSRERLLTSPDDIRTVERRLWDETAQFVAGVSDRIPLVDLHGDDTLVVATKHGSQAVSAATDLAGLHPDFNAPDDYDDVVGEWVDDLAEADEFQDWE